MRSTSARRSSSRRSPRPVRGRCTLAFRGVLNDQLHGFYRSTYTDDETGEKHTIATTQFEAADARRAFPCWDEPDLKAVFGDHARRARRRDGDLERTRDRSRAARGRPRPRPVRRHDGDVDLPRRVRGRAAGADPARRGRRRADPGRPPPGEGPSRRVRPRCRGVLAAVLRASTTRSPTPTRRWTWSRCPTSRRARWRTSGCITYRESPLLVDPAHATQPELENIADVVAHELAHSGSATS